MDCLQKNKVCPPENRAEGEPKLEKNPCENHARKSDAANMKNMKKEVQNGAKIHQKSIKKSIRKKNWKTRVPGDPGLSAEACRWRRGDIQFNKIDNYLEKKNK